MLRARIIPCLLVHDGGLVKTQNFKDSKYVGDPINAVKIFNEKEADELMVLDIDASVNGVEPDFKLIEKLAAECRMPLCYGGGVTRAEQAAKIIAMGVEKVAVSAAAIENPELLTQMAGAVGKQSVVAVLDIRKKKGLFSKGFEVCTHNATRVV
ncbi:HisA/HisF-related TIM barrel protein, partial [Aeromonas caviae]|uniref:HisA/HisF-related TIM barrel protein n=1 Tax=Aeromonas caviae TaxID=648 RepID=UPI001F210148